MTTFNVSDEDDVRIPIRHTKASRDEYGSIYSFDTCIVEGVMIYGKLPGKDTLGKVQNAFVSANVGNLTDYHNRVMKRHQDEFCREADILIDHVPLGSEGPVEHMTKEEVDRLFDSMVEKGKYIV